MYKLLWDLRRSRVLRIEVEEEVEAFTEACARLLAVETSYQLLRHAAERLVVYSVGLDMS